MLQTHLKLSLATSLILLAVSSAAHAQSGWAEQRPVQFRYSDQGMTNEVYRNQLGISGAAAAASVAISSGNGGASGGGAALRCQSSGQLQNVIQVNPVISNTGGGTRLPEHWRRERRADDDRLKSEQHEHQSDGPQGWFDHPEPMSRSVMQRSVYLAFCCFCRPRGLHGLADHSRQSRDKVDGGACASPELDAHGERALVHPSGEGRGDLRIGVSDLVDGTGVMVRPVAEFARSQPAPDMMMVVALAAAGASRRQSLLGECRRVELNKAMEKKLGDGRSTMVENERVNFRPIRAGTLLGSTHYVTGAITELNGTSRPASQKLAPTAPRSQAHVPDQHRRRHRRDEYADDGNRARALL